MGRFTAAEKSLCREGGRMVVMGAMEDRFTYASTVT